MTGCSTGARLHADAAAAADSCLALLDDEGASGLPKLNRGAAAEGRGGVMGVNGYTEGYLCTRQHSFMSRTSLFSFVFLRMKPRSLNFSLGIQSLSS